MGWYSLSSLGIAERCFYHPAPLTKRNVDEDTASHTKEAPNALRPTKRKRISKSLPGPDVAISSLNDRFTDAVPMVANQPGYLGPTSYSAILPKDEASAIVIDAAESVASDGSDFEMAHQHPLTKSMRVQMATEVLRCLRHYSILQEVLNVLLRYAQTCIVSNSCLHHQAIR